MQQLQGFYCVFKKQFLGVLSEKDKKKLFRRLWSGKLQVFQAQTGTTTAKESFNPVLGNNFWAF